MIALEALTLSTVSWRRSLGEGRADITNEIDSDRGIPNTLVLCSLLETFTPFFLYRAHPKTRSSLRGSRLPTPSVSLRYVRRGVGNCRPLIIVVLTAEPVPLSLPLFFKKVTRNIQFPLKDFKEFHRKVRPFYLLLLTWAPRALEGGPCGRQHPPGVGRGGLRV